MTITILLFFIGLILIIKGGDIFVESSINIARAYHLPEIFIGATIVSIATTAPEAVVSIAAATKGHTTMSIGNAIGSVICNTGLILGITNIISPSIIKGRFFKAKSIILLVVFIVFSVIAYDSFISKNDSILLIALLLGYIILDSFILKYKKNQTMQANKEVFDSSKRFKTIFFFIIGIIGIVIGSNLLINNGIVLAEFIGVPESVISLSLIALGTSLPELTTSLTALKKGHTSLSAGNIIGANILNLTLVIGSSGMISSLVIEKQNLVFDFPITFFMISILAIPSLIKNRISRFQSITLLLIYIIYITILYKIHI